MRTGIRRDDEAEGLEDKELAKTNNELRRLNIICEHWMWY